MKKSFFLMVVFFLLQACSLFNSSDDGGSITLRLPENSSREVFSSSTGSTSVPSSISYYFIRVRKSGEVVQEAKASPGSSVTIGDLYPGEYTVAVFCVDSSGIVNFYGRSPDVHVSLGETSEASVTLQSVDSLNLGISVNFSDIIDEFSIGAGTSGIVNVYITAKAGGMTHSYNAYPSVTYDGDGVYGSYFFLFGGSDFSVQKTVKNFLEPGISYKFSMTASCESWPRTCSCSLYKTIYVMTDYVNSIEAIFQ